MKLDTLWALAQAMFTSKGMMGFRSIIMNAENEVAYLGDLVEAGEGAVQRLDTGPPGRGVNVMVRDMPWRQRFQVVPIMVKTVSSVATCGKYMMDKITPTRHQADEAVWQGVHDLAREYGAVEVGFTKISENDIFEGYAIPYQNAVVFTIDMEKDAIDTAPDYPALIEVIKTYAALGDLALALSDYLRDLGYGAYPGFPIGGLVDYVRVGQDAGIGAIGYHGMLISPAEGTRQRIGIVFTNMQIPEPEANSHGWILDFCAMCQKCVRDCPPQAIYTSAESDPITGRKPTIHYDACLDYYGAHQGCAVCVRVCPFSNAGYDKIHDGFLKAQARRRTRVYDRH